ncbi:hypothetical protein ACOCJ4_00975 [Knoellia sp. CPCC 206435]|uniref:hypothetical protein n=1 Tax=Knoellia terrae TaxID=3404797 RepID=UPI003B42840B
MQPTRTGAPGAGAGVDVPDLVGRIGGGLLAAAFGLVARLRGTRALHPVGFCGTGVLTVSPGERSGVVLLDDPGPHPCLVRWSRATGLRDGPDIEGLAVRVDGPAAGDVLLASTGTGALMRHVITVRGRRDHGPLTTLLPLSTARGPLLLRLDPESDGDDPPTAYRLLVSAPLRPWHERGRLDITWTEEDCTRRHDPVGHPPTGTWTHPLWARLRQPSYAVSQQVGADPEEPRRV